MIKAINELADLRLGKTLVSTQLEKESAVGLKPYLRSSIDMGRIDPRPSRWTRSKAAYVSAEQSLVLAIAHPNLVVNTLMTDMAISAHLAEVKPKCSNVSADFIRFALLYSARLGKSEIGEDTNLEDFLQELAAHQFDIPSRTEQDEKVQGLRALESSVIAQENAVAALRIRVAETFLNVLGKPQQGNSNFVEFVPLGSLATVSRGITLSDKPIDPESDQGIRCLATLTGDPLAPAQEFIIPSRRSGLNRDVLKPSDVVISRSLRKLLLAIIWRSGQAEARFMDRLISIRVNPQLLNATYLLGLLRSPYASQALAGSAAGSKIGLLSKAALESFPVPLPPMDLQIQFAESYELATEIYNAETNKLQLRQLQFHASLEEVFREYSIGRD